MFVPEPEEQFSTEVQRKRYDLKGRGKKSKIKAHGCGGRSHCVLVKDASVLLSVYLSHTSACVTKKMTKAFKTCCYSTY